MPAREWDQVEGKRGQGDRGRVESGREESRRGSCLVAEARWVRRTDEGASESCLRAEGVGTGGVERVVLRAERVLHRGPGRVVDSWGGGVFARTAFRGVGSAAPGRRYKLVVAVSARRHRSDDLPPAPVIDEARALEGFAKVARRRLRLISSGFIPPRIPPHLRLQVPCGIAATSARSRKPLWAFRSTEGSNPSPSAEPGKHWRGRCPSLRECGSEVWGAVASQRCCIYTYFPDKAAIPDAVLDDLLGDAKRPSSRLTWRDGLVSLMSLYRRLLLTQPGLIALTVSRPMLGPNALRLREDMLTLLRRGGLNEADVVSAFLALFAYATGFVTFETARTPGNATPSNVRGRNSYMRLLPEEFFPSTRALPRLAKRPGDVEFTRGLHAVISGFARST
jgi:AcrR family transcriptional regulator